MAHDDSDTGLLTEGIFGRAWADLKRVSTDWRFRVVAAALTAAFAVAGALSPGAGTLGRAVFAVAGSLGGALLLGVVVFGLFVVWAPTRQRNEARGELRRLTVPAGSNAEALMREFSTWVRAKRAALPDWPGGEARLRGGLSTENPVYQSYNQTRNEVQRQARVEYHERFRDGILALVGESHEQANDPRSVEDLEAVEELLRQTEAAQRQDVDDKQLGGECSTLGSAVQEFVMGRATAKPPLEIQGEVDPDTGLPPVGSEAFQRAKRLSHDLQTRHVYEQRFAGRVFSLVRVLKEREYVQPNEIGALNYPESVEEIDWVGSRLEQLGRRIPGDSR